MPDTTNTIAPELDLAMERLADRFPGHPQDLRDRIAKPIQDAYQRGRMDALAELMTSEQVAGALGITRHHVTAMAKRRGVGWSIGRDVLFRPEDVEVLRGRQTVPGRPKET